MEISQGLLGALFSLSAVTGAGLGVLWSLIRLLRGICGADRRGWHTVPVRILLTGMDVLFGVLCGVALILLLYYVNDGQFRLLAVLGLGCGFFAWYHTLGRLLGALTDRLSAWLYAALRRLSRLRGGQGAWCGGSVKRAARYRRESRGGGAPENVEKPTRTYRIKQNNG